MTRNPRLMPADPQLFTAQVVRSVRISPTFQRVTIASAELAGFEWSGHDHWFRLFLPPAVGVALQLPFVSGRAWYKPYLAIPDAVRPHCSNYTVADFRPADKHSADVRPDDPVGMAEMDIDVVLHWNRAGDVAGAVAIWATTTTPGSPMALLDQGPLFDPPSDVRGVHLVADETGLPAIRGILRSLDRRMTGSAILEVPTTADLEPFAPLVAPPGIRVSWVARDGSVSSTPDTGSPGSRRGSPSDPHLAVSGASGRGTAVLSSAVPGAAALAALRSRLAHAAPDPLAYAFVVGESALATEARRAFHRAGLPKSRITFSGYWKHSSASEPGPAAASAN